MKVQNLQLHQELIAQTLRSNLVFYNLTEIKEDPLATMRDVLANKMKIDPNNEIEIELRPHRLGRKRCDGKPRPFVTQFLRCQDKEVIRNLAYLIKRASENYQKTNYS